MDSFLRMTETMTFEIIDFSVWDILYSMLVLSCVQRNFSTGKSPVTFIGTQTSGRALRARVNISTTCQKCQFNLFPYTAEMQAYS
jgi:hypothetical protein